ncbi:hypothetical protein TRVL_06335 [Trypanosoma vivax]|nr:hypothetical protein TRVL_06335 [Trypanosoma vivax]
MWSKGTVSTHHKVHTQLQSSRNRHTHAHAQTHTRNAHESAVLYNEPASHCAPTGKLRCGCGTGKNTARGARAAGSSGYRHHAGQAPIPASKCNGVVQSHGKKRRGGAVQRTAYEHPITRMRKGSPVVFGGQFYFSFRMNVA